MTWPAFWQSFPRLPGEACVDTWWRAAVEWCATLPSLRRDTYAPDYL